MDLILWRHADAEEGLDDASRKLTLKGRKQAAKMAQWLRDRLPRHYQVMVSPAVRTRETAAALAEELIVSKELGLSASPESILRAAGWPSAARPVVIVGHQPTLGMTAGRLLCGGDCAWSLRKGAFVWIVRTGEHNTLRAALVPEML